MIILFFILNIVIFIFGYITGTNHALHSAAEAMHDVTSKLSSEAKAEFDKIVDGEYDKLGGDLKDEK